MSSWKTKESGSLSQKSPLDLIVELYRDSVTGSLKFDRAPLQKAIFFREGQILFAASNDPKDQLASILVEEGKLGPDQMQVAQGRVSSGNPLAKVLTELGYISQRELADAARIKVEKILTDVYTWSEGTYQFVTKSPKVAIADSGSRAGSSSTPASAASRTGTGCWRSSIRSTSC